MQQGVISKPEMTIKIYYMYTKLLCLNLDSQKYQLFSPLHQIQNETFQLKTTILPFQNVAYIHEIYCSQCKLFVQCSLFSSFTRYNIAACRLLYYASIEICIADVQFQPHAPFHLLYGQGGIRTKRLN